MVDEDKKYEIYMKRVLFGYKATFKGIIHHFQNYLNLEHILPIFDMFLSYDSVNNKIAKTTFLESFALILYAVGI